MTRHHHHGHHGHGQHSQEHGSSHQSSSHGSSRAGDRSSSSSDKYGCWKGTPISYTGQTLEQDRSPHITLKFSDGTSSKTYEAQINVASTSKETQLVYWLNRTWTHPLTKTLTSLSEGFHQATTTDGTGLSLDFLRTKPALVDFAAGQIVQDSNASAGNDILSDLEPVIKDAIAAKASVYVFGRDYQTGIDDVHMNQGNGGSYEDGVGIDGE